MNDHDRAEPHTQNTRDRFGISRPVDFDCVIAECSEIGQILVCELVAPRTCWFSSSGSELVELADSDVTLPQAFERPLILVRAGYSASSSSSLSIPVTSRGLH